MIYLRREARSDTEILKTRIFSITIPVRITYKSTLCLRLCPAPSTTTGSIIALEEINVPIDDLKVHLTFCSSANTESVFCVAFCVAVCCGDELITSTFELGDQVTHNLIRKHLLEIEHKRV